MAAVAATAPAPLAAPALAPAAATNGNQPTAIAGNGNSSIAPGPALGSGFSCVTSIAADAHGNSFIAATSTSCIVRVDAGTQLTSHVAGTCGTGGAVTAGPAKSSLLPSAGESAVDRYDNLYVPTNYRVLKITDPAGWARGEPTPPPLGSPTSPAS